MRGRNRITRAVPEQIWKEYTMEYVARLGREARQTLIDFPDCPGCQTFADPHESVEAIARNALEGWLEAGLEHGDSPPRPTSTARGRNRLAVRINPTLAVRLQLRWARLERGLSQSDLASLVGVSRQQISLLESPDANLTLSTLLKVASALEMDLEIELQSRSSAA